MLLVRPEFEPAFQRLALTSCAAAVRHFADEPAAKAKSAVHATGLVMPDDSRLAVFFKQYVYSPPAWKFIGRASKARCEFQNYEVFARLGIPAATPVACGEERDGLGRLGRAFIVTRAIPEAATLAEFVQKRCAERGEETTRRLREHLLRQLADMTRRIHDAGFFHFDLVWRNILVTESPPVGPKLWWIDCPRGRIDRWSPWRRFWRLRDLTSLDKVASQLCTRGERLNFVKLYLGKALLDGEVKKLVHAAIQYGRNRQPDDAQ